MDDLRQHQLGIGAGESDVIKAVCEQTVNQPVQLWDTLAAQGIDATPGTVYQALSELNRPESKAAGAASGGKYWKGEVPGLTADDVEVVGALANKVGGLDRLISVLTVMQGLIE